MLTIDLHSEYTITGVPFSFPFASLRQESCGATLPDVETESSSSSPACSFHASSITFTFQKTKAQPQTGSAFSLASCLRLRSPSARKKRTEAFNTGRKTCVYVCVWGGGIKTHLYMMHALFRHVSQFAVSCPVRYVSLSGENKREQVCRYYPGYDRL